MKQLGQLGDPLVGEVVVGRRVRNGPAAVLQGIAGPNGGVGIVEALRLRVGPEVLRGAVGPPQWVGGVGATPAIEPDAPGHRAVQVRGRLPNGIGGHRQRPAQGVDIGVGRADLHPAGQRGAHRFGAGK
nr:hypothetical protein [Tanacetum cinerariifolium]